MIVVGAVCRNWGCGRNGGIPWDNKDDMRHFVRITRGKTLIVGKGTIVPPLPGRRVVVPDRTTDLTKFKGDLLIGGPTIWRFAFENGLVSEIYLTYIDEDHECDAFFPHEYLKQFSVADVVRLNPTTKVVHYVLNEDDVSEDSETIRYRKGKASPQKVSRKETVSEIPAEWRRVLNEA